MWKFGPSIFEETPLSTIDALPPVRDESCCLWVEVTGLADTETVAALGRAFDLHELSLEDVLDPGQRAKVEHYDDYTFVVLQTLRTAERVEAHQLNVFFGEHFIVTLQDGDDPAIEPIRERLRRGHGRIRTGGPDYFAYTLIETAKLNGVDPQAWLTHVLDRIADHKINRIVWCGAAEPILLKYGGISPGGVNFDAKVRRESFEPIDLFYAHIGGMDAFARGLKVAAAIRAD